MEYMRVLLPPPRNKEELLKQIEMLEKDIFRVTVQRFIIVLSGAVGAIILGGMILWNTLNTP